MFYYLFEYLETLDFPGAGMFQYISFRSAMAVIFSLIISLLFGKRIIRVLQRKQIGEAVRDLGLKGQDQKKGTPSMGGLIILTSILVPNRAVWRPWECVCDPDANYNRLAWICRIC